MSQELAFALSRTSTPQLVAAEPQSASVSDSRCEKPLTALGAPRLAASDFVGKEPRDNPLMHIYSRAFFNKKGALALTP